MATSEGSVMSKLLEHIKQDMYAVQTYRADLLRRVHDMRQFINTPAAIKKLSACQRELMWDQMAELNTAAAYLEDALETIQSRLDDARERGES